MKLYEFVDRLYTMGDMESPKTIKPKKVLNESLNEDIQINFPEYDYTPEDIKKAALAAINETGIPESEVVAVTYQPDNGYEYDHFYIDFANGDEEDISGQYIQDIEDLAYSFAEAFTEYIEDNLTEEDEDDLDEGVLGGLAGAAIGGLAGNSLGHPILGAIGGGLAGSAIQNALNDDLDESYDYELFNDLCKDYEVSNMSLNDIFEEVLEKYGDEGLADDVVAEVEAARESMYDDYDESLTEAANPENAEVNAALRRWANSGRNRLSKRDQKALDDAGIKLKKTKYGPSYTYAVHKDNEGDIIDLKRMDRYDIKDAHPDHDLANDLATTGRHWSNRDRYNKNKNPNVPWRTDAYREETPEESKALRPYSDKYKSLKRVVDDSEGYPYWHAGAERDLDDFKAKMAAKKNESLIEDKDLSTVKGSMTKILQDNREKIDACGSAKEVHDTVAGLLAEAGLDTQATRRLLLTLKKQKGLTGALQAVYNSILKGSDLGTLK